MQGLQDFAEWKICKKEENVENLCAQLLYQTIEVLLEEVYFPLKTHTKEKTMEGVCYGT